MNPAGTLDLLHLEDDLTDAELIRLTLEQKWPECRIQRVENRRDFTAALARDGFDLILSDFSLVDFNGLEALDLARQLRAEVPFIFLSGTIGEENAVEALKRGATDYVIKDRMRRLVPAIQRALEQVRERKSREQAEDVLREQAELLDKARDAIYVRDLEDHVVYWNRSAERIYGYAFGEVEGRRATEIGFLSPQSATLQEAKRILLEKGEWTGEFRAANKAGQEFDIQARWSLVRDAQGAPRSILCIDSDITEQKKLETQFLRAQRLESVGMLAGGIAHDLNNVLAPILMAVGLLQQKYPNAEAKHLLEVLESSAQHGAGLVRQVLAFARGVEGERVELQPDLIVRDVMQLLTETLPRSIALETELARDLWLLRTNATQFSQVIMNLCVNARDAMPQGGRIVISAQNAKVDERMAAQNPGAKAGPHVEIGVADTGGGIPPGVLDRIFDPFFTTKAMGKGTGLGLSTVLGIVKSHGGFLRVQSQPGQGTHFRLYFPAASVPEEAGRPAAPAANTLRGNGETILVIEDEDGVRTVVRELLQAYGYVVQTASDGLKGLELYRADPAKIDAVLTDMMMPTMQGAEVVTQLRALNPDVRIVAMSGMLDDDEGPMDDESGRMAFVQKPMSGRTLVEAIQQVLRAGR